MRRVLVLAILFPGLLLAQTVDELGDDSNVYSGFTGAGRGNIIDVTTDVLLVEIRQSVNLDMVMNLNFVVKHWDPSTSTWAIEMDLMVPGQGPGHPTYWSSGPISHMLLAGERYAIMMYWSGTGDYYNDNSAPVFGPVSFGNHFDNAWENSYPPSPFVGSVTRSWIPHQWYLTAPACAATADLQVRAVDTLPTDVLAGTTGIAVSATVENAGTGDADLLDMQLSFTGSADRTPEYTVTPDPGNPTGLAAGVTDTWQFLVDVAPAATLEAITIDAAITGSDVACTLPLADPGADVTDGWTVVVCLAPTCGDCNGDLTLTILDALTAAQHSAGLITLTGIAFSNCNVIGALEPDPSAAVSILDALTLAQSAAGLPVALVCC